MSVIEWGLIALCSVIGAANPRLGFSMLVVIAFVCALAVGGR
jgi:hypothetical protein